MKRESLWEGECMIGTSIQTPSLFPELETPPLTLPVDATVVVSISGGKDSVATLLVALETFGLGRVLAHHQVILEDWPGTVDYCQDVCSRLKVPLYQSQAHYSGYACATCHTHFLSSSSRVSCRVCGSTEVQLLTIVESVLDLVRWRKRWPSLDVRFCTSYLKRDVFNQWARAHRGLFADAPHAVIALGERWRESKGRSRLPLLRARSGMTWMLEWRPILHYRRLDVFRLLRDHDIAPHYCYQAQGMSEEDMYERNVEGGPRMSCVMCFLKSPQQMQASYHSPEGRAIITRGIALEREIGHTLKNGQSLESMVTEEGV